jgi:4'-phosphopantetheinyl transferase
MRVTHNVVRVWLADPRDFQSRHVVDRLTASLSRDERLRHQRLHYARDRHTFVVAHGLLRQMVGRYAGREAHACKFSVSEHGRPELLQEDAEEPLRFNLSHTRGLVAWAFSMRQPCGVDVEEVRYDMPIGSLAEAACSSEEREVLAALCGPERTRQFYRFWCLKEALLKGCGVGLTDHLECITIREVEQGYYRAEDRLRRIPREAQWFLHARMQNDNSHVIAVAYEKDTGVDPAVFVSRCDAAEFASAGIGATGVLAVSHN